MRTLSLLPTISLTMALLSASSSIAQHYDLVVLNGRVIDPETMLDDVLNVGVKDGKITAITEDNIQGKETIDASGHVVCAWFYRHA